MRLTDYTEHTLRTLMYLAVNRDGLATIQEIATAYGISKNHLMKVVHRLSLSGLVDAVRGRGGGLRLGKEPRDISIGAVVRWTEPDFTVVECFDPAANECTLAPFCSLKNVLNTATQAYLKQLDRITLADVIKDWAGVPAHSALGAPDPSTRKRKAA